MASNVLAFACATINAIRPSAWLWTEVTSPVATLATQRTCLVAYATCPMIDIAVSTV